MRVIWQQYGNKKYYFGDRRKSGGHIGASGSKGATFVLFKQASRPFKREMRVVALHGMHETLDGIDKRLCCLFLILITTDEKNHSMSVGERRLFCW